MTPDALLAELQTRGIKVRIDGERLMVTAPARSLTPGLSAAIKKHKAALIERLPATPRDQLPLGVMTDPAPPGGDSTSSPAGSDQEVSEPTPAETALIALLDQWESADNPRDPEWVRRYAAAAIAAGAQCFETITLENETIVQVDAGPHGWARWQAQAEAEAVTP